MFFEIVLMEKISVTDLCSKHRLSEDAVIEEVENELSRILMKCLGYDVQVAFNSGSKSFEVFGFPRIRSEVQSIKIIPKGLSRSSLRWMLQNLEQVLDKRRVLELFDMVRPYEHSVKQGIIYRIVKGDWYVDLMDIIPGETPIAICKRRAQPPRERTLVRGGEALWFYIIKILPVIDEGVVRLEIRLSRNSRALVVGLLRMYLDENGDLSNWQLRCTRRIAGAYSHVEANQKLPRPAIQFAAAALGEHVVARW